MTAPICTALRILGHALRLVGFLLAAPGLFAYDGGDRLLRIAKRRTGP